MTLRNLIESLQSIATRDPDKQVVITHSHGEQYNCVHCGWTYSDTASVDTVLTGVRETLHRVELEGADS